MNSEIIAKVDNFEKLPLKQKIKFFEWVNTLKEEYCILKEENTILKEGFNLAKGDSE